MRSDTVASSSTSTSSSRCGRDHFSYWGLHSVTALLYPHNFRNLMHIKGQGYVKMPHICSMCGPSCPTSFLPNRHVLVLLTNPSLPNWINGEQERVLIVYKSIHIWSVLIALRSWKHVDKRKNKSLKNITLKDIALFLVFYNSSSNIFEILLNLMIYIRVCQRNCMHPICKRDTYRSIHLLIFWIITQFDALYEVVWGIVCAPGENGTRMTPNKI